MAYRNKIIKLSLILYMLAFTVSIIFLTCAFALTVPKNVFVNGIDVGGLTFEKAAELIREETQSALKQKRLVVNCENGSYVFSYPEINYKDNVYSILREAKKGDKLTASTSYYLCGINEIATGICLNEGVKVVEPSAKFIAKETPFVYSEGCDGREADKAKLIEDIRQSLKGGFEPVTVTYYGVKRKSTLEEVRKNTLLLAKFTTYYDGDNLARSSNIRLAAAKLNGSIIESKKTLSFNDIVGDRIKSRGFLPAKIIENGEFTEGVGGGVCQVSTTLYNAALLSGLEIAEYHPHSLPVSYVAPSRDAMVSGRACDLKITNTYNYPVYICARTGKGFVSFEVYGRDSGAKYSLSSIVTGKIPVPEEKTDDPVKAREGKEGIKSEGYIEINRDGYVKRVLLRRDKYAPVKKLVYETEEENDEENLLNSKNSSTII